MVRLFAVQVLYVASIRPLYDWIASLDEEFALMANKDGVPDVIGVAPDGPAGKDDIESKPNPEGPSQMWEVSVNDLKFEGYVATEAGVIMVRIIQHAGPDLPPALERRLDNDNSWSVVKDVVVEPIV